MFSDALAVPTCSSSSLSSESSALSPRASLTSCEVWQSRPSQQRASRTAAGWVCGSCSDLKCRRVPSKRKQRRWKWRRNCASTHWTTTPRLVSQSSTSAVDSERNARWQHNCMISLFLFFLFMQIIVIKIEVNSHLFVFCLKKSHLLCTLYIPLLGWVFV